MKSFLLWMLGLLSFQMCFSSDPARLNIHYTRSSSSFNFYYSLRGYTVIEKGRGNDTEAKYIVALTTFMRPNNVQDCMRLFKQGTQYKTIDAAIRAVEAVRSQKNDLCKFQKVEAFKEDNYQ